MKITAAALVAATALVVAGCGSSDTGSGSNTVNWWTWDDKQAVAYGECEKAFEAANSGVDVKITRYNVDDYFTKLTAGFVAGTAPDAFQNSVQFLQAYASQNQLMPLDDLITKSSVDLKRYSVGVDTWKFTDGTQYGLPLDWAASAFYYNADMLTKAGVPEADVQKLSWNPDDGGAFDKVVARLTVDKNGRRGDEPGFDKTQIATYGIGAMAGRSFIGETSWAPFVNTLGWRLGDKDQWPSKFNYTDPRFTKTMKWVMSLTERGFSPKLGTFTTGNQSTISDVDLIGSGKVAMTMGGSWSAASFGKIPGVKVGIAPTVLGPEGKRSVLSNSNGNNIWAGTKNPDLTWKWVSYMGSEECQTRAGATGTFFPSIPAAMDNTVTSMKSQGVDLSVFNQYVKDGVLHPSSAYANGSAVQSAEQPLFEAYFAGQRSDDVFPEMERVSQEILAKN
ncbi:ABC transporter substrate-binding protein [Lentzea flaviverrucosa]|uniref:Multiple sugar transport system substrate-binding protein n=1 Tax=Lentzea flaviverrucosa TaxID=200379 RepID=A0A1H9G9V0_9PSEU|nr:sugar ABC transporter substrate-binding protein [Lentzea flaviverrucosa]RDI34970.1 carbohydrate ABC transporter substrate-binding protein (CUT1 family) [Lentzea flaviverrucosa]SEQ46907.1 multiple sugar transport system substrate-binding protein [Lentzea flaviverrucosa]